MKRKNIKKYNNWTKVHKGSLSETHKIDISKGIFNPLSVKDKEKKNKDKSSSEEKNRKIAREIKDLQQKQKEIMIEEGLETAKEVLKLKEPPPEICFVCGRDIKKQKSYQLYYKDVFSICIPCYLNNPSCSNCGFVVKNFVKGLNTYYCQFCKPNKVCTACGKTFVNKDLENIENVKGIYCRTCIDTLPRCFSCGIPIYKNAISLPNSRISCQECSKRLIVNDRDLSVLTNKIYRIISSNSGILIKTKVKTALVNSDEINSFTELKPDLVKVIKYCPEEKYIGAVGYVSGFKIIHTLNNTIKDYDYIKAFSTWLKNLILKAFGYIEETVKLDKIPKDERRIYKSFYNIENTSSAKKVFERVKEYDNRK